MAKVSGLGGWWVVTSTLGASSGTIQHNAEYEADIEGEIDDVTDSSSTGWRQGLPIIKKINSLTLTIVEDDAAYPEALGLTETTVLDIWLKRGAKTLYDKASGTIVRNVRVVNDQTKARRIMVTCEYGSYTRSAVAPA